MKFAPAVTVTLQPTPLQRGLPAAQGTINDVTLDSSGLRAGSGDDSEWMVLTSST